MPLVTLYVQVETLGTYIGVVVVVVVLRIGLADAGDGEQGGNDDAERIHSVD